MIGGFSGRCLPYWKKSHLCQSLDALDVMSTTLPLFWHLSSASKLERLNASVQLIGALEQFQANFEPNSSKSLDVDSDEEDQVQNDALELLNAQDVSYSIRRLVRGLASSRESSRLGFAVALTELLSRIQTVTCSQIVSIIIKCSSTQGSMTGQEERDTLFARLFGLTAVVQSGLLCRPDFPSSSTPSSNLDGYKETISQLIVLGEKKSWLRESAWWTIGLAIDALEASDLTWKQTATEYIFHDIFQKNTTWTPDKVALAVKLQTLHPERDWSIYLSPTFKHSNLLSTGNLTTLSRILRESNLQDEAGPSASKSALGNWKPQVHFVWDTILDQLLPKDKSTSFSDATFQEFFRVAVDESIFSSTSSPEKKYWGFQIFQKALPRVGTEEMPMLFTKNFMRSWINHLSKSDRYLHNAAKQVATDIQSFVHLNPTLGYTLILQLTGANGNRQFDKLTKTRTVESILSSMDTEGIESYIQYLLGQANEQSGQKDDIQFINARRAWVIDQLGSLIRNSTIPKSDGWVMSILDWLIVRGMFVVTKKSGKSCLEAVRESPLPVFSDDLRQGCRTRLTSCLADLTAQSTLVNSGTYKGQKIGGVASDGDFWVSKVLTTIKVLEQDNKHVALIQRIDERDIIEKAFQLTVTLQGIADDERDAARGAELILSALVLQHYAAEDEETDNDVLEACIHATDRWFTSRSKKIKNPGTITDDSTEVPTSAPIDVLVDSIIGFLERSTTYFRVVGNQAFSMLSSFVEESTIDLILTQLERRSSTELAADEKDGDIQIEEDDRESGSGATDGDEDLSDVNSEGGNESAVESDDPEAMELRQEALMLNGIDAVYDLGDESDEELMDDEQMMAIDDQLAQIFKIRANEIKSKGVDAHREATHFKNRVLDLIDIFIRKQPANLQVVRLILPLAELVSSAGSDERQMGDKAAGILRNRIGKAKDVPTVDDVKQVSTILEEVHTRARRARSADLLSTLSSCSLYLTKILVQSGAQDAARQIYHTSLSNFITRKSSTLNTSFFQNLIHRHPLIAWELRDDLVDVQEKAANTYRQCQTFQLLQVLLNQAVSLVETHPAVIKFMPKLKKAIYSLMDKACDDAVLSIKQIKDVLKVGVAAVRQTRRLSSSAVETIWQPTSWEALAKRLSSSKRLKGATALHTLCKLMITISRDAEPSREEAIQANKKANVHAKTSTAPKRKAQKTGESAGEEKLKRKKVKLAED